MSTTPSQTSDDKLPSIFSPRQSIPPLRSKPSDSQLQQASKRFAALSRWGTVQQSVVGDERKERSPIGPVVRDDVVSDGGNNDKTQPMSAQPANATAERLPARESSEGKPQREPSLSTERKKDSRRRLTFFDVSNSVVRVRGADASKDEDEGKVQNGAGTLASFPRGGSSSRVSSNSTPTTTPKTAGLRKSASFGSHAGSALQEQVNGAIRSFVRMLSEKFHQQLTPKAQQSNNTTSTSAVKKEASKLDSSVNGPPNFLGTDCLVSSASVDCVLQLHYDLFSEVSQISCCGGFETQASLLRGNISEVTSNLKAQLKSLALHYVQERQSSLKAMMLSDSAGGLERSIPLEASVSTSQLTEVPFESMEGDGVIVTLWRSRRAGKLYQRAQSAVCHGIRSSLLPSAFRSLPCVSVSWEGLLYTVTWAAPLLSDVPLDASGSTMLGAAVSLLSTSVLGREVLRGVTDAYASGDGSYVIVPGPELVSELCERRSESMFIEAVLSASHPSLCSPTERVVRALRRSVSVVAELEGEERVTFLRDVFHSCGARMRSLLQVRSLLLPLAVGEARDAVLAVVRLVLSEAVARALKGMVLSRATGGGAGGASSGGNAGASTPAVDCAVVATAVLRKLLTSSRFLHESLVPALGKRFPTSEEVLFDVRDVSASNIVRFLCHRLGLYFNSKNREFQLVLSDGVENFLATGSGLAGRKPPLPLCCAVAELFGIAEAPNRVTFVDSVELSEALAGQLRSNMSMSAAVLSCGLMTSVYFGLVSIFQRIPSGISTAIAACELLALRKRDLNAFVICTLRTIGAALKGTVTRSEKSLPQECTALDERHFLEYVPAAVDRTDKETDEDHCWTLMLLEAFMNDPQASSASLTGTVTNGADNLFLRWCGTLYHQCQRKRGIAPTEPAGLRLERSCLPTSSGLRSFLSFFFANSKHSLGRWLQPESLERVVGSLLISMGSLFARRHDEECGSSLSSSHEELIEDSLEAKTEQAQLLRVLEIACTVGLSGPFSLAGADGTTLSLLRESIIAVSAHLEEGDMKVFLLLALLAPHVGLHRWIKPCCSDALRTFLYQRFVRARESLPVAEVISETTAGLLELCSNCPSLFRNLPKRPNASSALLTSSSAPPLQTPITLGQRALVPAKAQQHLVDSFDAFTFNQTKRIESILSSCRDILCSRCGVRQWEFPDIEREPVRCNNCFPPRPPIRIPRPIAAAAGSVGVPDLGASRADTIELPESYLRLMIRAVEVSSGEEKHRKLLLDEENTTFFLGVMMDDALTKRKILGPTVGPSAQPVPPPKLHADGAPPRGPRGRATSTTRKEKGSPGSLALSLAAELDGEERKGRYQLEHEESSDFTILISDFELSDVRCNRVRRSLVVLQELERAARHQLAASENSAFMLDIVFAMQLQRTMSSLVSQTTHNRFSTSRQGLRPHSRVASPSRGTRIVEQDAPFGAAAKGVVALEREQRVRMFELQAMHFSVIVSQWCLASMMATLQT